MPPTKKSSNKKGKSARKKSDGKKRSALNKSKISATLKRSAFTDRKRIHVVSRGSGWALKMEGSQKAFKIFRTKEGATKAAKSYVTKHLASAVVIHKIDGTISRY